MSVLGIDLGKKRIGLAVGTVLAEEFKTLKVKSPAESFFDMKSGTTQAIDELLEIVRHERIDAVVVGLPQTEGEKESENAKLILVFVERLKDVLEVPVETVDETLTSFAAQEILRDEGLSIEDAKGRIDQVAAKLILQQYLEDHY